MGLAVLLKGGELDLVVGRRPWLKEADHLRLLDAQGLLDTARAQAERWREDADAAFAQAREEGRALGLGEGREQAAAELAGIALQSAAVLRRLESAIARAVDRALAGVVGGLPAEDLYEAALRQAAQAVRGEVFLVLRVPPQHEGPAREALRRLSEGDGPFGAVELVVDASLPPHACVLASEAGTVSAGLDVHLQAISAAVSREVSRLAANVAGGRGEAP